MCSSCGRGETGCLGRGPWGLSGPRRVGSHLEGLDLQGGVGLCDSAADISVERYSWGRAAWCFGKSRGLESSRGSALCLWACHSASLGFSFLASKRGGQPQWSHCFNSLNCCCIRRVCVNEDTVAPQDGHAEGWPCSMRPTIKAWCSVLPWQLVGPGGVRGLNSGLTPLLQVRSPSQQHWQGLGRGQHSSCHPSTVGISSLPTWGMTQIRQSHALVEPGIPCPQPCLLQPSLSLSVPACNPCDPAWYVHCVDLPGLQVCVTNKLRPSTSALLGWPFPITTGPKGGGLPRQRG